MHRDVLTHFPFLTLVVIGQLTFFSVFAGALFWVFRKNSKSFYDKLAKIPLEGAQDE